MPPRVKVAEQTYTFSEVCRLLHIPPRRARALQVSGELVTADVLVPGGGRQAERWTASRVAEVMRGWSTAPLG